MWLCEDDDGNDILWFMPTLTMCLLCDTKLANDDTDDECHGGEIYCLCPGYILCFPFCFAFDCCATCLHIYRYSRTNAFHVAASTNDLDQIQLSIKNKKNQINCTDSDGFTPLHMAVKSVHAWRRLDSIKLLIDNGANVNAVDKLGNTPLHYAQRHRDNREILSLLIMNGGNIMIKNEDNESPLSLSNMKQYMLDMAKLYDRGNRNWLNRRSFIMFLSGTNYINSVDSIKFNSKKDMVFMVLYREIASFL